MTTPTLNDYLGLVINEHADKPKLIGTLSTIVKPAVDLLNTLGQFPLDFDLDQAAGQQLDAVGLWIGRTRYLSVPITGVYFAWDTPGVGWEQGVWYQSFNPTSGLVTLPDDGYRTLLRAKIIANHWNGTIPGAYEAWDALFGVQGLTLIIEDGGSYSDQGFFSWDRPDGYFSWDAPGLGWEQGPWFVPGSSRGFGWDDAPWFEGDPAVMTMTLALWSPYTIDAVTKALFTGGYLGLKPAGVRVTGYLTPTVPNVPFFGWDLDSSLIAGWDVGAWAAVTPGS